MKFFGIASVIILVIIIGIAILFLNRARLATLAPTGGFGTLITKPSPTSPAHAVRAENNTFSPNHFQAANTDLVSLQVTAVDHDYDFILKDLKVNEHLPSGTTKRIEFYASGVGNYTFTCGTGCSGSLSVFNPEVNGTDENGQL